MSDAMRGALGVLLLAGLGAAPQETPRFSIPRPDPQSPQWPVMRVLDAQTLLVRIQGRSVRVRLLGVQTPADDRSAREAQRFLEDLLRGESVHLDDRSTEQDRRAGQVQAYVFRAPEGLLVNLEVLRQGYGTYAGGVEHPWGDLFAEYAQRARQQGRGLWRRPTAAAAITRAPTTSPAGPQADPATLVYVTASGTKYHSASCRYARGGSARAIPLSEARRSYRPCTFCKPPR